jgi:SseB protein N-terminal domain
LHLAEVYGPTIAAVRHTFPQNDDTVRAMDALARGDDPEKRRSLYEALLRTDWLVPTSGSDSAKGSLSFVTIRDAEDAPAALAFTDESALLAWRAQGQPYAVLHGALLFGVARDNGFGSVIVNPRGPAGGVITRREIELLALDAIPDFSAATPAAAFVLGVKSEIEVLGSASLPDAMARAIGVTLSGVQLVRSAHLARVSIRGAGPTLMLGVMSSAALPDAEERRIAATLGREAQANVPPDQAIDILFLTPTHELAALFARVPALYQAKR